MADRVDSATRSKIMAAVRSRNTSVEKAVRSLIHRLGYRYSLQRLDLPGKPDIVFVARKKIIFVHGCFWHNHFCRHGFRPKSNTSYWNTKIDANKIRDQKKAIELRKLGWSVMTVWQCELKNQNRLEYRIARFLDG